MFCCRQASESTILGDYTPTHTHTQQCNSKKRHTQTLAEKCAHHCGGAAAPQCKIIEIFTRTELARRGNFARVICVQPVIIVGLGAGAFVSSSFVRFVSFGLRNLRSIVFLILYLSGNTNRKSFVRRHSDSIVSLKCIRRRRLYIVGWCQAASTRAFIFAICLCIWFEGHNILVRLQHYNNNNHTNKRQKKTHTRDNCVCARIESCTCVFTCVCCAKRVCACFCVRRTRAHVYLHENTMGAVAHCRNAAPNGALPPVGTDR